MKSVISALVIFIIIVTMVVTTCVYTETLVNKMLHYVYKNENYVAKNNWSQAVSEMDNMCMLWKNSRIVMVILFNHSVIERIDGSIERLNNTVKLQKKEDFFYESKNLELLLENLIEQQKISVGNVL